MRLAYPAVLAALLFSIGVYGVLARRNAVLVLAAVELMLNAVVLHLVAFDAAWSDALHGGQVFSLFVITLAAAEIGVGLAIVLLLYRNRATAQVDEVRSLRDDEPWAAEDAAAQDATAEDAAAEDAAAEDAAARAGR